MEYGGMKEIEHSVERVQTDSSEQGARSGGKSGDAVTQPRPPYFPDESTGFVAVAAVLAPFHQLLSSEFPSKEEARDRTRAPASAWLRERPFDPVPLTSNREVGVK